MSKKLNKFIMLLILGFILLFAFSTVSIAAEYLLKMTHGYYINSGMDLAQQYIKEIVERKSEGRIEVQLFPYGRLGPEPVMLNKVRDGTVQGATILTGTVSAVFPAGKPNKLRALDLPYLFSEREQIFKFLRSKEAEEAVEGLEPLGLIGVAMNSLEFMNLATRTPVRKFTDLKKMKLRMQQIEMMVDLFRKWGCPGVVIPFDEVYSSFQRGVADGYLNFWPGFRAMKIYEVLKYVTVLKPICWYEIHVYNKSWWDKLPPDLQKLLWQTTKESQLFATYADAIDELETMEWIRKTKAMEIIELPPEEFVKFKKPIMKMHEEQEAAIGKDYLNRLYKLVDFKKE